MGESLSYNQFATRHGLVTDYDVLGHIHSGLCAAHMPVSHHRRYQSRLAELQNAREEGHRKYKEAIERGDVEPPQKLSLRDQLAVTACGDPDKESTQAAIRTLARLAARATPHREGE